jgi:hypothetical protein
MRNRCSVIILVVAVAAALAGSSVSADEAPQLVGVWDTVASTPDGDLPGIMTITDQEGVLEVAIEMGGYERDVTEEKLDGGLLTMTVLYDGSPYDVELTVSGDVMEGSYSGMAASGAMKAKRRP